MTYSRINMPPKTATTGGAPRKGSQFKPPRPVKAPAQASTTAKRPSTTASRAAGATKTSNAPAVLISSEDEQDEEEQFEDSDDLMELDEAPVRNNSRPLELEPIPPPVPAPLLARLLYENFEDSNTQIQKGAMNLTAKYIEIFVREAFARAKNERETAVKGGSISDGFLQVEDLEKLVPQLVLDF